MNQDGALHTERAITTEEKSNYEVSRQHIDGRITEQYRKRLRARKQEFGRDIFAYRPFVSIVREHSRVDDSLRGANGCADHAFVSKKLREIAEHTSQESSRNALVWLAEAGDVIRSTREQVLSLITVDVASSKSDIDPVKDEGSSAGDALADRSPGDIPETSWDERTRQEIIRHVELIQRNISLWQETRDSLNNIGSQCRDKLDATYNEEQITTLIQNGSLVEAQIRDQAFRDLPQILEMYLQVMEQSEVSDEDQSRAFITLMENLTNAQAVLEGQYYYVGTALIRATQNGRNIEPPQEKNKISPDAFSMNLSERSKTCMGESGKEYRGLTPLEMYQLSCSSKGIEPNPDVIASLSNKDAPLIDEWGAMVMSDEKVYRPRHSGSREKVIASGIIMDQLNTPHAELVVDVIDGETMVFEHFYLNAEQATPQSVEQVSVQDANLFIAHMLITEDLDCHARNFVQLSTGSVIRVDSKFVFQDGVSSDAAFDTSTIDARTATIESRVRDDPFVRAVVGKCNQAEVEQIINNFDIPSLSEKLRKLHFEESTIAEVAEKIRTHQGLAPARLQKLKQLVGVV